jgi:hypothetical protein
VLFAAFAETKSDLYEAPLEKHLEGYEREAIVLCRFGKFADFPAVEQQFAFALADVIVNAGLGVLSNVAVAQPDFPVVDSRVAFVKRDLVIANAFDFTAGEDDSAIQLVENVKFVSRTAIAADDLAIC